MADSQDDVQSEITPEDFDGEQDTPKAESSPAKEAEPKAEKPEAKSEETAKTEPEDKSETEEVEPPEDDSEETEDEKPSKAEERKQQLNTEIRDLVAQRNQLKREVEQTNSEAYQAATKEELVAEGLSDVEATVEAMRQQQELDRYNNQVAEAQLVISSESERVLRDFPVFNPDSEQYDKELAEEAAVLLESNLVIDQNTNQVIGSNVSPYQLYKTLAKASGISAVKGRLEGQKATERQLANVDGRSSSPPAQKTKDPLEELWSEDL